MTSETGQTVDWCSRRYKMPVHAHNSVHTHTHSLEADVFVAQSDGPYYIEVWGNSVCVLSVDY